MSKAVLVACAGWKGSGRGTESVHLPAPFLPLGDGTTAASRTSAQFRSWGYEVALVVGPLGYPYRAYQPRHEDQFAGLSSEQVARNLGLDPDASPWTDALHRYVRKLGTPVVVDDPGYKSKHDSFCEAYDRFGKGHDRLVLVRGDKLYRTWFLQRLLETLPWPSQFSFEIYHSIVLLDGRGMVLYRGDAEPHRRRATSVRVENWGLQMSRHPDAGEGMGRLARAGIPLYGFDTPPWDATVDRFGTWCDVDYPAGYERARGWITESGEYV